MVAQLKTLLLENRANWGLPTGGAWNFWLYNNWHPHDANLDIMWFHDNDEFPCVITKLDCEPRTLVREFEGLTRLSPLASSHVPKPLQFGKFGDFWALWMEGVPGLPFQPDGSEKALHSIVQMLVSIHSALRTQSSGSATERRLRIAAVPLETVARFGNSAAVRDGCARLSRRIDDQWIGALPVIPQHGDLYLENIISFRGHPYVLDWETFGVIDLPFYDLLTFLLSLLMPHWAVPKNFDHRLVQQLSKLLEHYASRMGLPMPDPELLLPLVLANWFQLMWMDGRKEFTERMYGLISHFFEHPDAWRPLCSPLQNLCSGKTGECRNQP